MTSPTVTMMEPTATIPLAEDFLDLEALTVTTNLTLPTTSEAAIKALANLTYVLVPFGWSRMITDNQEAVYYITPSGRVLFSHDDASRYINSTGHCRCYLNTSLAFTEVFCFDATVGTLALPKSSDPQKCIDWIQLLAPVDVVGQIRATKEYLKNHEAADPVEARRAAGLTSIPPELDLRELLVTRSGDIFYRGLTTNHLKHLAFEYAQSGVDLSLLVAVVDAQENSQSDEEPEPEEVPVEGFVVSESPSLVFVSQPSDGSDSRAIQLSHDGTVSLIDVVYQVEGEEEEEEKEEASDAKLGEEEILTTTIVKVRSSCSEASSSEATSEPEVDNGWQPHKPQIFTGPSGIAAGRPKRQSAAVAKEKIRLQHQQLRRMRALEAQEDEELKEDKVVVKKKKKTRKVVAKDEPKKSVESLNDQVQAVDMTKSISTDSNDAPLQCTSLTPQSVIQCRIPSTQSIAMSPGHSVRKPPKNATKQRPRSQPQTPCRIAYPSIRPIAINSNRIQRTTPSAVDIELIDLVTDDEEEKNDDDDDANQL